MTVLQTTAPQATTARSRGQTATAQAVPPTRSFPKSQDSPLPRLLPGLLAGQRSGRLTGLNQHERSFGPLPLPEQAWSQGKRDAHVARRAADRLIDVVERSGLTGKGGAGFPVARKLRAVAAGQGPAVVVANGCEGEPASRKDRLLLNRSPHLVLDGLSLAAFAVGADAAYLVVHDEATLTADLEAAVAARDAAGIDPVPIEVVGVEHRYVASEQTAIVQYLNGGPGLPTFAPPRTHERGVRGRPGEATPSTGSTG